MEKITINKNFSGLPVEDYMEISKIAEAEFRGNESAAICALLHSAIQVYKLALATKKGKSK